MELRYKCEGSKSFLVSGVTEEERKILAKEIQILGGKYFDLQYFKAICTHVVCGKLSKSEKFLGACASGKWVVHPDFIHQSVRAGTWLDEEQFEWCDQYILQRYTDVTVSIDMLYASRRWRFELGEDRHGAFVGWKVAVVAGAQKSKVMKRLLISGGAEVFNLSLPVRNPAKVANTLGYIFVSEQNIRMVAHLFEYGVLCVRPDYIGDFLLKDPPPDPMDYLIHQTGVMAQTDDILQSSGQTSFLMESQHASSPALSSTPNQTGAPTTENDNQDLLLSLLEVREPLPGGCSTSTQRHSPRIIRAAKTAEVCSTPTQRHSPRITSAAKTAEVCSTPTQRHSPRITSAAKTAEVSSALTQRHLPRITSAPKTSEVCSTSTQRQSPRLSAAKTTPAKLTTRANTGTMHVDKIPATRSSLTKDLSLPHELSSNTSFTDKEEEEERTLNTDKHLLLDRHDTSVISEIPRQDTSVISEIPNSEAIVIESDTKPSFSKDKGFSKHGVTDNSNQGTIDSQSHEKVLSGDGLTVKPNPDVAKSPKPHQDVARTPKGIKKVRRQSFVCSSPITAFFKPVPSPNTRDQCQASTDLATNKQETKETVITRYGAKKCLSELKDGKGAVDDAAIEVTIATGSSSQSSIEATREESCSQEVKRTRTRKRKSGQGSGLQQYFKDTKRQKVSESEWRPTKFSTHYADEEGIPGILCMHSAMTQIIQTTFEEEDLIIMALQELKARVSQKYCPPHETLALLIHKILPRDGSDVEGSLVYEVLMQIVHHHPPITGEMQQLYLQALAGDTVAVGQEWRTIQNCIRNILNGDTSGIRKRNSLLFQFIREVIQQSLQYFVLQEKMCRGMKHLWLRILWCPSYHVVFNSRCRELLSLLTDTLTQVRAQPEPEQQGQLLELLQDITWLIAMAAECCRLEEVNIVRGVWSLHIERVSPFVHEISRRLIDANIQCRRLLQSVLSGLQLPWLCVGVCQQLLNNLDDYLLTESSPRNIAATSLAAIVGHYFYLLPRLHIQSNQKENLKPDQNHRLQTSCSKSGRKTSGLCEKTNMAADIGTQCKKVNKKNMKGETQLHRACIEGNVNKVIQLLQIPGIDVNAKDNYGWTPLHEACNHGHTECVRQLLKFVPSKSPSVAQYFSKGFKVSKVDVLACNEEGITPLHDAVINNRVEVAQVLLQHGGAKLLSAVTVAGLTPVQFALTEGIRNTLISFTPVPRRMSDSQDSYSSSQETCSGVDGISLDLPSDMLYEEVLNNNGVQAYADRQGLAYYIHLVTVLVHNYILAVGLDTYRDCNNIKKAKEIQAVEARPQGPVSCVSHDCIGTNCPECYSTDKENIAAPDCETSTNILNSIDLKLSDTPESSISDSQNGANTDNRNTYRKDMMVFKHFTKYVHRFETHLLKICHHDDRNFVASELLELKLII